ncbi:MAG: hypothetical protein AAGA68_05810 [Pseudomonadota bacterium]
MNVARSFPELGELEARLEHPVLLLGAVNLEMDLVAELFELVQTLEGGDRLGVLIYCRGGVVNAARRVALLLRERFESITFIAPHYCASAGTLTALSGDHIIASPASIFSPIDPLLSGTGEDGGPAAVSSQDVRLFREMAQVWFHLSEDELRAHALTTMAEAMFPTTLTAFYRTTLEVKTIAHELLAQQQRERSADERDEIVDRLLFHYHSHNYAITAQELTGLGLSVSLEESTAPVSWALARKLGASLGAGARKSEDEGWMDTVIATRDRVRWRRVGHPGLGFTWEGGR